MGTRVLVIGFDPDTIDFDTEFFRRSPITPEAIAAGIATDTARIAAAGYDHEWLLVDARDDAAATAAAARTALAARQVDVVVIGGGVRLNPAATPVLEALVNAVHEAAPTAKIAFNTHPTNTAEAIARWA